VAQDVGLEFKPQYCKQNKKRKEKKKKILFGAGGMAQVVEYLLNKHEA
jgi:hypothetical protein